MLYYRSCQEYWAENNTAYLTARNAADSMGRLSLHRNTVVLG